eukprot:11182358-Alexandrium_andersonii.AAC.1
MSAAAGAKARPADMIASRHTCLRTLGAGMQAQCMVSSGADASSDSLRVLRGLNNLPTGALQ